MILRTCLLAGVLAAVASPAFADSIDFAQFGTPGTMIANGASGTTNGGVAFTISGMSDGFTEYLEDYAHDEAYSWAGEFAYHETILFNDSGLSPVTINFATPVASLQDVEAQANASGSYTATLKAYNGATLLGTVSYDSYNSPGDPTVEGTIPHLDFFGNITSVQIFTTNDGLGFALGGTGGVDNPPPPEGGVPEPGTWAMMLAGFGGVGGALRRRKSALKFA